MSYTDNIGQANYNKKLANCRAQAVANELEADGVNMSRIHIIYADILPAHLAISPDQDRRVDLLYEP
jgi:outer membrane protein OmpA-like peptidoglycan-associated protein